jgi:hypothetical protein
MRICIDIDNTLLDYNSLFIKAADLESVNLPLPLSFQDKNAVKNFVKEELKDEQLWLRIQGHCYGHLIEEAPLFDGALEAIKEIVASGHEVVIIGHKSKKSYCGSYTDLQEKSLKRLTVLGIVDVVGIVNIHYRETVEEKIKLIAKSKPDLLIDDLVTVIEDQSLINIKNKILFSAEKTDISFISLSWSQVKNLVLVLLSNKGFCFKKNLSVRKNIVTQVSIDNTDYVLKLFLSKERYIREKNHLILLDKSLNNKVPSIKTFNDEGLFILMGYIVDKEKVLFDESLQGFLDDTLGKLKGLKSNNWATDSRISYDDYAHKMEERLEQVVLFRKNDEALLKELTCLIDNILNRTRGSKYSPSYISFCLPDLSLKNILNDKSNYFLIDFESSGMDDPIRSLFNFYFHPHHHLSKIENEKIFDLYYKHFPNAFNEELFEIADLVAMDWLLIEMHAVMKNNFDADKELKRVETKVKEYLFNVSNGIFPFSLNDEMREHVARRIT